MVEISHASANCKGKTPKYGIIIDSAMVFHIRALDGLGIVGEAGRGRHDELWCFDELAVGSLCLMRLQVTHGKDNPQEGDGKQITISGSKKGKRSKLQIRGGGMDVKMKKKKGCMRS